MQTYGSDDVLTRERCRLRVAKVFVSVIEGIEGTDRQVRGDVARSKVDRVSG